MWIRTQDRGRLVSAIEFILKDREITIWAKNGFSTAIYNDKEKAKSVMHDIQQALKLKIDCYEMPQP